MGSKLRYEYHYRFLIVDADEVTSMYKLYLTPGLKSFLFEFRTNFILKRRPEEDVADAIIDSERYGARVFENDDGMSLYIMASHRLKEYWMADDKIELLLNEAFDFAKRIAANPQHASFNLIPIVVYLDVCTVQQEGESFDSSMDRAIRAQNMIPLYLCPFVTGECKPLTAELMAFLRSIRRIRVEDIDKGLALMVVCPICLKNTKVGAQISLLRCRHAFHSHCIVGWLEGNNVCPSCQSPAYDRSIARGPPVMRSQLCGAVPDNFGLLRL